MATVAIAICQAATRAVVGGQTMPVVRSEPVSAEAKMSSGVSARSDLTAPAFSGTCLWSITASGGAIWVKFGADPIAAEGDDWLILDGQTREFGVSAEGETVAFVDVT